MVLNLAKFHLEARRIVDARSFDVLRALSQMISFRFCRADLPGFGT